MRLVRIMPVSNFYSFAILALFTPVLLLAAVLPFVTRHFFLLFLPLTHFPTNPLVLHSPVL